MINVAAAIIRQNGKILICQRGSGGSCALLWEFPGGKLEERETIEECLIRECKEELDIRIKIVDLFGESRFKYPEQEFVFSFYNAEIVEGTPLALVHHKILWATREELNNYQFCEADTEIVEQLAKGYAHLRR